MERYKSVAYAEDKVARRYVGKRDGEFVLFEVAEDGSTVRESIVPADQVSLMVAAVLAAREGQSPNQVEVISHGIWGTAHGRDRLVGEQVSYAAADMLMALRRQQTNIRRWLESGIPATADESKSISDQIDAAIAKAVGA